MKIYKSVQKLLVGDRQTGDLLSLVSFLEGMLNSKLKLVKNFKTLLTVKEHRAEGDCLLRCCAMWFDR
jgi:hypothetical protein